jgi:hypothetical protein
LPASRAGQATDYRIARAPAGQVHQIAMQTDLCPNPTPPCQQANEAARIAVDVADKYQQACRSVAPVARRRAVSRTLPETSDRDHLRFFSVVRRNGNLTELDVAIAGE